MLCHGSSFLKMSDDSQLYKGYESFVAPEVMNNEGGNERSDVYSLAKFIEWLFKHGGLSYEYKKVIAKATKSDPMQRYASVSEMEQALRRHRNTKRSVLSFVGAVLIALFVVFLYFELMPKVEPIEFVKGVEPEHKEDLLDGGFNPDTELGVWDDDVDPADTLSPEERKSMEEYQAKAEEIFKKRFTKEADRIIGTIYSKDRMNLSEHVFVQSNSKMADELLKIQGNLAEEAGISEEKANKIASGIIDNIMAEKEKTVERYGVQKADKDQSE
jgi:serine/threonine protein kinase